MADLSRPRILRCVRCGTRIRVAATGRLPTYCSVSCKQMAYAKRTRAMKKLPPASIDERQRRLIWGVLQDAGLVPADKLLPARREDAA